MKVLVFLFIVINLLLKNKKGNYRKDRILTLKEIVTSLFRKVIHYSTIKSLMSLPIVLVLEGETEQNMADQKFKINDNLIYAAFYGSLERNYKIRMNGWVNADNGYISRLILTHCVQKVFQIHRAPGFEEEYKFWLEHIQKDLKCLTKENLNNAYQEVQNLYNHVQSKLTQKHGEDGKTVLYRSLPEYEVRQIISQLEKRSSMIEFQTNILTSYTLDDQLSYTSKYIIAREVDIKRILFHYEYVKNPWHTDDKLHNKRLNVEQEIIVINDDPFGKIVLPIENIRILDSTKNKLIYIPRVEEAN